MLLLLCYFMLYSCSPFLGGGGSLFVIQSKFLPIYVIMIIFLVDEFKVEFALVYHQ